MYTSKMLNNSRKKISKTFFKAGKRRLWKSLFWKEKEKIHSGYRIQVEYMFFNQ